MSKKVWEFIKYNNGFLILVLVVFVVGSSVFAMGNETVQEGVAGLIGERKVVEIGVDNSALLHADIDGLAKQSKITTVTEDVDNFYIDYEFKTMDVVDNKWQEVSRGNRLTVPKAALGDADLGVYALKQINEVVAANLEELKLVQKNERALGRTEVTRSEEYSGLLGVIMDIKGRFVEEPAAVELVPSSNLQDIGYDGSEEMISADSSEGVPTIEAPAVTASTSEAATVVTETGEETPAAIIGGSIQDGETVADPKEAPASQSVPEKPADQEEPAASSQSAIETPAPAAPIQAPTIIQVIPATGE